MLCVALVMVASLFIVMPAYAGTLCNMIRQEVYVNSIAKAIGTIGVLMVTVGAALGRMSWTLAVTVACGISAMAIAPTIAATFGGGC